MDEKYCNALLENVLQNLNDTRELTRENVVALYSLFSDMLFESLQIVESKAVLKRKSRSGRYMFIVSDLCLYPEESQNSHERDDRICLLKPRHCSCPFFLKSVILESKAYLCRHLLAMVLADMLNKCEIEIVDDLTFADQYYRQVI